MRHPARFSSFSRLACLALSPLLVALLPAAHAQTVTPAEKPYVGGYTSGTVDTRTQLMLLDDNTFCFTFMGGSLDMVSGGRWKAEPTGGVRLQEVRQETTLFPAFVRKPAEGASGVQIEFDGYTFSSARSPVFGVSDSDTPPATLRPLFPEGQSNWAERYTLPAMKPAPGRNIFVGNVETGRDRQPVRVKVTQYRLLDASNIRLAFDQSQARAPLNLAATLADNVLSVDGRRFGKRDELPERVLDGIRKGCIKPALDSEGALAREKIEPGDNEDVAAAKRRAQMRRAAMLVPVKSFDMDLATIHGAPYFPAEPAK
jgi:hypothetical protein